MQRRRSGSGSGIDRVDRGGLRRRSDRDPEIDVPQVALRADELELVGVVAQRLRGLQELRAGGVAAGAAVVDGRVPVREADEEDGVDRLGRFGVAEPDRLPPLLATRTHPSRKAVQGLAVVDDHRLDEEMLAGQEQLSTGLGRRDRGSSHELGHLLNGLGAQCFVRDVLGHSSRF